jgi:HEAT repeat protein
VLSRLGAVAERVLADQFRTGDRDERRIALRGLHWCSDLEARKRTLEAALEDSSVEVRGWAAFLLVCTEQGQEGEARARQLVLADPSPSVRMHAAFKSLQIKSPPPPELFPCFVAATRAGDAWNRSLGVWYLEDLLDQEEMPRKPVIEALLTCLESEHGEVRLRAAQGLAGLDQHPPRVLEALSRHLDDEDDLVAHFCREGLGMDR